MSADERRYSDEEVRRIFARATEAESQTSRALPTQEDGLSLTTLQEIGRDVGIAPEVIAQAAASLDVPGVTVTPASRYLGMPVGVSRTLYLNRRLTDREWEQLVMDLRETFDAAGIVRQHGNLRQWSNGNLRAMLEPTDQGERLRLRTVKGDARPTVAAGGSLIAGGAAALVVALVTGNPAAWEFAAVIGLGGALPGAGMLLANWIRLPRWASVRARQMEGVIARLNAALTRTDALPPSKDAPTS